MRKIIFGIFFALISTHDNANAIEPLSCRMQTMLHMFAAERRNQGSSREETIKVLKSGDELTDSEIKYIIHNVYEKHKNKTAKEIGGIIMRKCN